MLSALADALPIDPEGWAVIALAPFVGSFLATIAVRLPAGGNPLWGRSHCLACGHALGALDLVPLASWARTGGRCRHCGAAVSRLYPAVEFLALLLAVSAAPFLGGWLLLAACLFAWTLLVLAVIDWGHYILPDVLTLPLAAAGLLVAFCTDPASVPAHAVGALAGFLVFAAVREAYRRLRGREGLGLGDAKLLAAAGAWIGWEGLPTVVLVAAVAGLASCVVLAFRHRRITLEYRLPFGPYLCFSIWTVWLYGISALPW
jgi:leader peptidase (prepilin peptidase)/N-methyltransferase